MREAELCDLGATIRSRATDHQRRCPESPQIDHVLASPSGNLVCGMFDAEEHSTLSAFLVHVAGKLETPLRLDPVLFSGALPRHVWPECVRILLQNWQA